MTLSFNLDKKLIFLVLFASVTALVITGYLSFNYADLALKERVENQLLGESSTRGETLRSHFELRVEQNNILANDPMIQILTSKINQLHSNDLIETHSNHRDFLIQIQAFQKLIGFSIGLEDVKIIGVNGDLLFSLSGTKDENYFENSLFQRGFQEPFIEFEPAGTSKKMIVVSPIFANDDKQKDVPIGVIISKMRTSAMDNILLNQSGLGNSGEVYIVNKNHLMLSESRFFENMIFQQQVDTLSVKKCFNHGENHLGFYDDYRGIQIYGSSYCASDLGIVLLVEIEKSEIEEPIDILQDRILKTGIIITLGLGIIAFFMSKSLSRPLITLKNAANKIASGKFDVRTNIKTRDEIGELSFAFDSMAQKLQESLIEIKEKEEVIKQQEDILLKFSQHVENDCVGVIDMSNSTIISAKLSDTDVSKMYEIFLNFMARIVKTHNGEVIKNIGDALMFRFPNVDPSDIPVVKNIVECCLSMIDYHDELKEKLESENLPELDYKISITYGSVKVAHSTTSNVSDIFGPTVNRCFKINSICPKNSLVVGINLYDILKSLPDYVFSQLSTSEMKQNYGYSIFKVERKK